MATEGRGVGIWEGAKEIQSKQSLARMAWAHSRGGGHRGLDAAHSMCMFIRIHNPLSAKKEQWEWRASGLSSHLQQIHSS